MHGGEVANIANFHTYPPGDVAKKVGDVAKSVGDLAKSVGDLAKSVGDLAKYNDGVMNNSCKLSQRIAVIGWGAATGDAA